MKSCDNCKHYQWYYDKCERWNCEVDCRSVCSVYDGDGKHLAEKVINLPSAEQVSLTTFTE